MFTEVFLLGTGGMRQLSQAEDDAVLDAAVAGLNDRRSGGPHDSGHGQPFLLKRHQAVTLSGAAEVGCSVVERTLCPVPGVSVCACARARVCVRASL